MRSCIFIGTTNNKELAMIKMTSLLNELKVTRDGKLYRIEIKTVKDFDSWATIDTIKSLADKGIRSSEISIEPKFFVASSTMDVLMKKFNKAKSKVYFEKALRDKTTPLDKAPVNEAVTPKIKLVVTNSITGEEFLVALFAGKGDALLCRKALQSNTSSKEMTYSIK